MKTLESMIRNTFGLYDAKKDYTKEEIKNYKDAKKELFDNSDKFGLGLINAMKNGFTKKLNAPFKYFESHDIDRFATLKKQFSEYSNDEITRKIYVSAAENAAKEVIQDKLKKLDMLEKMYTEVTNEESKFTAENTRKAADMLKENYKAYTTKYSKFERFLGHILPFTSAGKAYKNYCDGVDAFVNCTKGIAKEDVECYAETGAAKNNLMFAIDGNYAELTENAEKAYVNSDVRKQIHFSYEDENSKGTSIEMTTFKSNDLENEIDLASKLITA